MSQAIETINSLVKALEAGSYNAAPSTLVQGAALQVEDLSPVMQNVTFEDKHIILQKLVSVDTCKSTLAQFDRQLSYGQFGGSAQLEGHIGQEETSEFVRITVPMCYYSHYRRVTLVANMVTTVDGKKAEDRAAADAAKKIAADIEFDLFRGKADFSNGGVFDGNPLAMPNLPNILGVDAQVRMSDSQRNAKDLMFAEFGSDESVVIPVNGTLSQDVIEDAAVRSNIAFGAADLLVMDPRVLANYNKIAFGKERIMLAGSPQGATGAELAKQWTSNGTVELKASQFLRGKAQPAAPRSDGPAAPASISGAAATISGVTTGFQLNQVYKYTVTAANERGESPKSNTATVTIDANGKAVNLTINHPSSGVARFFNVYRTAAGGAESTAKFIGRVALNAGSSSTTFTDLGNKQPGFVTGFLLQSDTMEMKELSPYSRLKLAVTELSQPEAHFRFTTLCVHQPRKNVLLDNLR